MNACRAPSGLPRCRAKDAAAERVADLAAEHARVGKAGERVGVEDLGPLVPVVAGRVADGLANRWVKPAIIA